jgi:cyclic beta-1,2-glucan synthetase
VRHGFGYSVFEHTENGLATELTLFVAMDAPVKFAVCKVRNLTARPRKLSVTGYWEWVLGDLRRKAMLHVQTEIDWGHGRPPSAQPLPGRLCRPDRLRRRGRGPAAR